TVDLPVNATVTFSFTVQINPSATGSLVNTATISPPAGVTDPNLSDNSDTDTDTLTPHADLAITKSVSTVAPVHGSVVTYTLVITILRMGPARGVVVNDRFPAVLTFVGSTASQGVFNASTGVWNVGGLAVGAQATLRVQARLDTLGSVVNTAVVHGAEFDP